MRKQSHPCSSEVCFLTSGVEQQTPERDEQSLGTHHRVGSIHDTLCAEIMTDDFLQNTPHVLEIQDVLSLRGKPLGKGLLLP